MKSYNQIFKSSLITGSAQLIHYAVGMLRVKVVAVLLGTSGVGLIGLYNSMVSLGVIISQMGIDQGGIREIAKAHGRSDSNEVASLVKTLKRICWLSGILGWAVIVIFAPTLGIWFFENDENTRYIVLMALAVLFGVLAGAYNAQLRGLRRILDLAKIQVFATIFSTVTAILIFLILGEDGIVLALVLTAFIQLLFSWWFSKRIEYVNCDQSWAETFKLTKKLLYIGSPFIYGALLAAVVAFLIRIQTVKELGIEANGIYQAVWAISGMPGGFIIAAMAADFYPRLTAASDDHQLVNSLVNEQIEIGTLLALPGLTLLTGFSPWVLKGLYSESFLSGSPILPWFVLGAFVTILIFPLGMIQRAKAATGWMYLGQTEANLVHLILIGIFTSYFGLNGLGYAYSLHIIIHGIVVFLIAKKLSDFRLTLSTLKLVISTILFILVASLVSRYSSDLGIFLCNSLLVISACIFSLRGLVERLGPDHKISILVSRISLLRSLVGMNGN